jgi:hypothetical protein
LNQPKRKKSDGAISSLYSWWMACLNPSCVICSKEVKSWRVFVVSPGSSKAFYHAMMNHDHGDVCISSNKHYPTSSKRFLVQLWGKGVPHCEIKLGQLSRRCVSHTHLNLNKLRD